DIHVRCAKASIEIDLARERETRSVDAEMAKTRFELDLPVARGGVYRIENARGNVSSPASVEGGVPVRIRAAKADVVIRAA
ncbi:MAG: hypothetical protein JWO66_515, partial [Candidatus Eremiobacteraeota bacterium]|nr:hypothetical protein [Candidatus Eremiobacteraeota bacterium]